MIYLILGMTNKRGWERCSLWNALLAGGLDDASLCLMHELSYHLMHVIRLLGAQ